MPLGVNEWVSSTLCGPGTVSHLTARAPNNSVSDSAALEYKKKAGERRTFSTSSPSPKPPLVSSIMSAFVETFVSQVVEGVSLDDALAPAIESETDLRRLFATDRKNPKLIDPFIGLVDVFATHSSIRLTQARNVQDEQDLNAHYVFPLVEEKRRADGEPAMAATLEDFKTAFNIFSEGSLSQLTDWGNVVVAGGAALACLAPPPKDAQKTRRGILKYFHGEGYPNSDIDIFVYGLTPEQVWF